MTINFTATVSLLMLPLPFQLPRILSFIDKLESAQVRPATATSKLRAVIKKRILFVM
jgi:hypothetical protein